jgi:glycosyltransferase involved in cell wall biosynthesis
MAPRVLIDGYFLGKPYGFGRFIFELCRALGRAETDLEFVVATPSRVAAADLPVYARLSWHRLPDANLIVWEQVMLPRLARRLGCGVIHFPYNTRALFTGGIPAVTTVHDLIFLQDGPRAGSLKDRILARYTRGIFQMATRRSRHVVSVSQTTQRLLAAQGVTARTVYNTADGFIEAAAPASVPPPGRRYVLHRGGHAPHRNTGRVIEAFLRARPAIGDVSLKILGAPGGAGIWPVGEDGAVEFLPRVSDAELGALYAGSSLVVAASLEEGFGLPIIEAFGFGAPVITSCIDPMQEVAGDAAVLVDPTDTAAISRAITAVLSDPRLAKDLVARGRVRRQAFGSFVVAAGMIGVYRECVQEQKKGRLLF